MTRPLRIEYAGAHYHVTSRENERKPIFRDDTDREKFLELIGRSVEQLENNRTRTMAIGESARGQIQESRPLDVSPSRSF